MPSTTRAGENERWTHGEEAGRCSASTFVPLEMLRLKIMVPVTVSECSSSAPAKATGKPSLARHDGPRKSYDAGAVRPIREVRIHVSMHTSHACVQSGMVRIDSHADRHDPNFASVTPALISRSCLYIFGFDLAPPLTA